MKFEEKSMKLCLFVALVAVALTTTAHSQDRLRWNGFVSIGGGFTLSENETMRVDGATGAEYDDRVNFRPDSLFALQAQVDLAENLTATAQLVGRGGNDFDVELEWAYISYAATDELTFSAGRKRLPIWLYSDSLEVGYSYHWIRPPTDLYGNPLNVYEGVNARYASTIGNLNSQVEVFFGGAEMDASDAVHVDVDNYGGVFWSVGTDLLLARVGWAHAKMTSTITIPARPPAPTEIVDPDNDLDYYTAAVTLNYKDFFVVSEFAKLEYERRRNDLTAWYVSAGYQMGAFTPHLTFSELRENETNGGEGSARVNQTTTAGVRWDFHESAALKFEFSTIQDKGGTSLSGDSDAIAIALDITF